MSDTNKEVEVRDKRNDKRYISPVVDIMEKEDRNILVAEIPGVSKENVSVELEKEQLVIEAKADITGNGKSVYTEFTPVVYFRKFSVGGDIDGDRIQAHVENGLLILDLPKSADAKPRKIEITE